jgi:NADH-quinone oxidoreductase subunit G
MAEVTIQVDGKNILADTDKYLLEILLENGIHVPHFCYHPAIGKDGNCRMCMVEIEGSKRPQISCDTPVKEGMVVRTRGENIEKVRKEILELELLNHPVDCPICDQAGECKLQDYYMNAGLYDSKLNTPKVHKHKKIDLGPQVVLDQERCVLCAICTRFTSNVTKTGELGIIHRGDQACVSIFPGRKLDNPYAMNVVDLCPVGALTSKDFRFKQRVWFLQSERSICHGCARGCNIHVDYAKEKYKEEVIYRFRPRVNQSVNGWFLCDSGRLSYHQENQDRLMLPLQCGEVIALEEALCTFDQLLRQHHKSTLFLLSPNLSLENALATKMLAQRFHTPLYCLPHLYQQGENDSLLIRADKSANRMGMNLLGMDTSEVDFQQICGDYSLIVVFGHTWIRNQESGLEGKVIVNFETHTFSNQSQFDLVIPMASFTEEKGCVVNEFGMLQEFKQVTHAPNAPKSLLKLLQDKASLESVRAELAETHACFKSIDWNSIPDTGILLEGVRYE